jgi:hypothetical protein
MKIAGFDKQTFLYLNGVSVDRRIVLSKNVELLPARPDCHMELFLGLGKTDADISIISLFLPHVRAQLKVTGADSEDSAKRAWNAIWDAILLGAITGSEVICNLHSDVSAEELTPSSTVLVTNYQLRGFREPKPLAEEQIAWIESNFSTARDLLDIEPFRNAIHTLASYQWHSIPRAQLALIWSAIEGLFGVESELVFRVSLYAAKFLHPENLELQKAAFSSVKKLYAFRSKAVHGGKTKDGFKPAVKESIELLNLLVMQCVAKRGLPSVESLVP